MAGVAQTQDLPADVQEILQDRLQLDQAVLDTLAQVLDEKLTKAINDRKSKGIEAPWTMAEEAYCGIDEANRGEYHEGTWIKPLTINAPVTTTGRKSEPGDDPKSTAFVRLTSRYVDAGAAKISEVILSPTDKSFNIRPLPVADLIEGLSDTSQVSQDGKLLERKCEAGGSPTRRGWAGRASTREALTDERSRRGCYPETG